MKRLVFAGASAAASEGSSGGSSGTSGRKQWPQWTRWPQQRRKQRLEWRIAGRSRAVTFSTDSHILLAGDLLGTIS